MKRAIAQTEGLGSKDKAIPSPQWSIVDKPYGSGCCARCKLGTYKHNQRGKLDIRGDAPVNLIAAFAHPWALRCLVGDANKTAAHMDSGHCRP